MDMPPAPRAQILARHHQARQQLRPHVPDGYRPHPGRPLQHRSADRLHARHLPALLGRTQAARTELVTQAFEAPRYALRSGQWKYIPAFRRQPERLFNLSTDPAEKHNLAPNQPDKAAEFNTRMKELTRESKH